MNDGEEKGRQRNERGRGRDGKEGRTGAGEVSNGKEAQGDSGGRCAGALGWKGGEREDLGNRGPKRIATRPPRSGPLELVTEFELFRARHQEFGAQQGTARFAGGCPFAALRHFIQTLYEWGVSVQFPGSPGCRTAWRQFASQDCTRGTRNSDSEAAPARPESKRD